ncbi:MAG TPA: tRNA preQ1(34) S-adenosylmethionine ribosyltransferase-isomerase QueA [Methylomirabilota bacterium]
MELEAFDYDLPPSAIAQAPTERRDGARLLLINRDSGALADRAFADLPSLLRAGDCLVVNNSRVIPARVAARDESGRPVELLFLGAEARPRAHALVRPGRRCRVGARLRAGGEPGALLTVVGVEADGSRILERPDGTIAELLEAHGMPPLPPYIARHAKPAAEDWERYQTVFARLPGSVAAPTAGLHFTPDVLQALRGRGIEVHEVTLHVGPATFRPIRTRHVEDHVLAPERVTIPEAVAAAVTTARRERRRIVAVGTTTTRALEGSAAADGRVRAVDGHVELYIGPGRRFQVVDALLTNFHLPRSSLLVLVAAFAGRELVLRAYRHAIAAGYRFYSYGDATLIV